MLHNIIKGVLLTIASIGCCGILVAGLIWLRSRTAPEPDWDPAQHYGEDDHV